MTNDVINRAVATALGMSASEVARAEGYGVLRNYTTSLDACAEFEATLTDEAFMDYANLIRRLSYSEEPRRPMLRRQMSAKALIRCKAYLKMKHLWTEQPAPSGANS